MSHEELIAKLYAVPRKTTEKAFDSGELGNVELRGGCPIKTPVRGIKFYSQSQKQEVILVDQCENAWGGWLCYRGADGQLASLRKATPTDYAELLNPIPTGHHAN